jgi:hypothetical protein
MKISLKDIGNFAMGAIERDKALNDIAVDERKEELKARRAILIAQKAKRYEKDIAKFEEEDKKYKAIQAVNKQFAGKTDVDPAEWGRIYLQNYKPTEYATMVNAYGGNTPGLNEYLKGFAVNKDFKTFSTEKAIDTKYQDEVKSIMADTTKQIKDARGDSFLINQILGLRNKKISEAESIKTESATGIEQAKKVNTEVANIETKPEEEVSFTFSKENKSSTPYINKSKEEYKSFANEVSTKLTDLSKLNLNKSSPNNGDALKQSFNILNIPNVGDYYRTNPEGKITEFRKGGEKFANTTSSQWKHYKDYLNIQGTDNLFLKHNGDRSKLVAEFDKENLNGEIAIRTSKFAVPIVDGNILGKGGSLDFTTVFRNKNNLIVVPTANTIDFDDTFKGTNAKVIPEIAKVAYANAMKKNAMVNNQFNSQKLSQNQLLLESLRYGKTSPLLEKVNEDFKNEYNKLYKSIELKNKNNLPEETNKKSTGLIPLIEITNPQTGTKRTFADTPDNRKKAEAAGATFVVIKSTQAESKSNTSNEFDDFGDAPFIPQRTRGEMSMEERRLFEKEKREKQKDIVSKRREEFNKKIRELNQSRNKPSQ